MRFHAVNVEMFVSCEDTYSGCSVSKTDGRCVLVLNSCCSSRLVLDSHGHYSSPNLRSVVAGLVADSCQLVVPWSSRPAVHMLTSFVCRECHSEAGN